MLNENMRRNVMKAIIYILIIVAMISFLRFLLHERENNAEYKTIVVTVDGKEQTYEHINEYKISEPSLFNGSLRFTDEDGNRYSFDDENYIIKSE